MNISEFKERNQEAQRINAEIQKAQGARDENERQFKLLCEQYEATYGEHIDANNLEEVLNRVAREVEAQAAAQAKAIELAKNGVVIQEQVVQEPVQQSITPAQSAVIPPAQSVAPQQVAVAPPVQEPVQATLFDTPPAQPAQVQAVTPPVVQQAAPPVAQPAITSPQPVETPTVSPTPISAVNLSAAALQQSNTQPDLRQPEETNNTETITPSVAVPGWGVPQGTVDFSQLLGGSFGGGN